MGPTLRDIERFCSFREFLILDLKPNPKQSYMVQGRLGVKCFQFLKI